MEYKADIGLEVHAELQTESKMFCSCPVVDPTQSQPNQAVCPVCAGMPGTLPVVNQKAVELAIKVALALHCQVAETSLFARKNYFYPDLPKGYQISQYEFPLAEHGYLDIHTSNGEKRIRIRRVHLEEDTGKLTHLEKDGKSYSLVDLNRAGVPLLEIVSEPDMNTVEEAKVYCATLRSILQYLGVNSGNMEKGAIRFEANVSVRPVGCADLGTRVEIKNLNSFRALEKSSTYQINEQAEILRNGGSISQETLGWNEAEGKTYSQRNKEEAHDYRYFPEPDLPPLIVTQTWIKAVQDMMPELPAEKEKRFIATFGLSESAASVLVADRVVAEFFEDCVCCTDTISPSIIANWITGEIFGWLNQNNRPFEDLLVTPQDLATLLEMVANGKVNQNTAKNTLAEMLSSGKNPAEIIQEKGLEQISDNDVLASLVKKTLAENPQEVAAYLAGKETLAQWFFGQVMRAAKKQGNPQVIKQILEKELVLKKEK